MNSSAPIRSRASEEGKFEVSLWSVPLILIVIYACLFSGLGALGLVGPDEPRYAAIARAMAETRDWVTPRLWGTPWFEKPVLYYWAAGAAVRVFGVSEFAARLPSALAALLAVLAVAWTALRSYGMAPACYALLMLPTSAAMIGFSRAASPDMLFAGMLTACMAIGYEMLQKPRPAPILRVAFGVFLGLAVLAKGPAAIILAGGATLLWAALARQWRAPFRFLHPAVIAVFCATALPWYVLCALRNPDFLRVFIWQHNFERYLTPIFEHRQPFWFFGPILLLGILPWLPLLIAGPMDAARGWSSRGATDSPALFVFCWCIFPLVFFSLSQSKLPGYILPVIPPVVLLLAVSLARLLERNSRAAQFAVAGVGIVFPLLFGTLFIKPHLAFGSGLTLRPDTVRGVQIGFAIALAGGGLIAAFCRYRKWSAAVSAAACTTALLVLITNWMVLPGLDTMISARPAAARAMGLRPLGPEDVAIFHLPRAYQYGLDYYFNQNLSEWAPENSKAKVLFCGKDGLATRQLSGIPDADKQPATADGKIYFVRLPSRAGE